MPSQLVQDALAQVWGNPDPSDQVILKPARLSAINGVKRSFEYMWTQYKLPTTTDRFHIYQIGQLPPQLINLLEPSRDWKPLSDVINDTNVMVDVYTTTGVQMPRTRSFFRWVDEKNLLIAVQQISRIAIDWAQPEVWVRLYQNNFFQGEEAGVDDKIVLAGGIMTVTQDILDLNDAINDIQEDEDYVTGSLVCFVNGLRRPLISTQTAAIGDVVEYVYDTTIYKVVDFPVTTLPSFLSTLDNKTKGLLHYAQANNSRIDYVEHIDVYLHDVVTGKGVYVHKNAADTLRQVTHKDYAITLDYLPSYYPTFRNTAGVVVTTNLRLRLHIRYSGQGYAPQLDANMSRYLMDLGDLQQVQAMVGVAATFPLWQAAKLEASAYMQLMRSRYNAITTTLVQQAYGFHRVNKVLADAILPTEVAGDTLRVDVPPAFQASATAFEYDADGVLLGVHACGSNITIYFADSEDCATVEFIEGLGGRSIEEFYGAAPVTLTANQSYRYYLKAALEGGSGVPVWQDVTGTSHYTVQNGVAYWGTNTVTSSLERIVRSDKRFLSYEVNLDLNDGLLVHQINYDKQTTKGLIASALHVPMGELDVWLNDHPLVQGIDYLLNFPTISVINKKFLELPEDEEDPAYQRLRIRMTGFCDAQLKINPIEDVGYVFNGVLSTNARHDLHKEKVLRVVVDGALKRLDEVHFVEEGEDVQETGLPIEGKPFQIRDMIHRLNGKIVQDAYSHYRATRTNEQAAETYLSARLPQEIAEPVSPIVNRYPLFSPFLSKILHDLVNDYLDLTDFVEPYSDALVRSLCAPYLYLLPIDPIGPGNAPNEGYCVIHPHPYEDALELPVLKYDFFVRAMRIYAGNKVFHNTLVVID